MDKEREYLTFGEGELTMEEILTTSNIISFLAGSGGTFLFQYFKNILHKKSIRTKLKDENKGNAESARYLNHTIYEKVKENGYHFVAPPLFPNYELRSLIYKEFKSDILKMYNSPVLQVLDDIYNMIDNVDKVIEKEKILKIPSYEERKEYLKTHCGHEICHILGKCNHLEDKL